jgi:hypothetical protein
LAAFLNVLIRPMHRTTAKIIRLDNKYKVKTAKNPFNAFMVVSPLT